MPTRSPRTITCSRRFPSSTTVGLPGVGLKFGCGGGFALDDRVGFRSESGGHGLPLQVERSGVGRAFRENDGIFRISAKSVLARLQPEQSGQRQPFLFEIVDQFTFPFLERLLVGGIDGGRGRFVRRRRNSARESRLQRTCCEFRSCCYFRYS